MSFRLPALIRRYDNRLVYAALWLPYIGLYQLINRFPLREPMELPLTSLDRALGFYPSLLPLYLAYIPYYWYTVARSEDDVQANRILYGTHFQLLLSIAVFLLYPVRMPRALFYRPELYNWADGFWRWFDGPNNCMPSLHVSNLLLMIQFNWRRSAPGLNTAIALAIIASTVLVKQHYVADVLGGAVVYLLAAWWLSHVTIDGAAP